MTERSDTQQYIDCNSCQTSIQWSNFQGNDLPSKSDLKNQGWSLTDLQIPKRSDYGSPTPIHLCPKCASIMKTLLGMLGIKSD